MRVVLVETSHPGNIGSVARAMKNMGFSELYLVNPKHFPDPRASELAAGADDVLEQAVIVDSLDAALAGCQLILMTSARVRAIAVTTLLPREAAEWVVSKYTAAPMAVVFGREYAGLTNAELLKGHYHIEIPANPEYSSLNLAQAVQIVCYEMRLALLNPLAQISQQKDKLSSHEEVEQFYDHLQTVLQEIGFLKPTASRRLMQRLRRLFGRVQLEAMEVNLLRGMLSRIQYQLTSLKKQGTIA